LRQIDFLSAELAQVEHLAKHALASVEIKRLMTISAIDVTTAATLIAAIGDIRRFESAKRLVGYLGLDARVRQSGVAAARHGHISKEGTSAARHVRAGRLGSDQDPGPLRAFYQRVNAQQRSQSAENSSKPLDFMRRSKLPRGAARITLLACATSLSPT
jgi:transposase